MRLVLAFGAPKARRVNVGAQRGQLFWVAPPSATRASAVASGLTRYTPRGMPAESPAKRIAACPRGPTVTATESAAPLNAVAWTMARPRGPTARATPFASTDTTAGLPEDHLT